jgi:DNA-binding transcriptional MerR regulator
LSLVSIGEFARLSRLSPKALRLYDELGLLVPAEVDAETGYRWYADTQLERPAGPGRSRARRPASTR